MTNKNRIATQENSYFLDRNVTNRLRKWETISPPFYFSLYIDKYLQSYLFVFEQNRKLLNYFSKLFLYKYFILKGLKSLLCVRREKKKKQKNSIEFCLLFKFINI